MYGRALGLPQDEGWYHRKVWEWTQCVYGLERLRAIGRTKLVLGVGAGHEPVSTISPTELLPPSRRTSTRGTFPKVGQESLPRLS